MGGAAVTFTANLSGSSASISWALSGPGSISASTGSSTLYTAPLAGNTPASATLTATAGAGLSAGAAIQITPPLPITISGRVIGTNSKPVAGAALTLGAASEVSDSDGHFSFPNVTPPYDLSAVVTTPVSMGVVYQGLRRPDPTILLPVEPGPAFTTTVTGDVTGGDPLGATDERTWLAFGSSGDFLLETLAGYTVFSNPYSLKMTWVGPISTAGTIHALQVKRDSGGLPIDYTGYASKTGVSVANSGTEMADIVLSAPQVSTIAGALTVQAPLYLNSKTLSIDFGDGASLDLATVIDTTTSFSFPFPVVPGGTATVVASASLGGSQSLVTLSGIAPGTTNLELQLRIPTTPISPLNQSTGVGLATEFSWTSMPGTTYVLSVTAPSGPDYFVVTSATSARFPDLTSQGLVLPTKVTYDWYVDAYGPSAGVDDLAGPSAFDLPGSARFTGFSATYSFTTP
jgi:hypothetical protein